MALNKYIASTPGFKAEKDLFVSTQKKMKKNVSAISEELQKAHNTDPSILKLTKTFGCTKV